MIDLRHFYNFLTFTKENFPEKISLIEGIENKFNSLFEAITVRQKLSLRQFPLQYVGRIYQEDGGWTSKLHIWSEEQVPEILNVDPMLLSFKNSYGETVLMTLVRGATGSLTNKMNYELIERILSTDYSYQEPNKDSEGNVQMIAKSAIEEVDLDNKTILDYLIDIAWAKGEYSDETPDLELQRILLEYLDFGSSEQENNTTISNS